ncbi:MAG: hypothetical protein DRP81_06215 [Candidatus Omnitrophota bacterium]|nr:MAG: hypothetical protein DRP81_06215 [Candidatus Omnitrophota bacterium]
MGEIDDLDVRISLIQALIPAGLERVGELLQEEVIRLAGLKENTARRIGAGTDSGVRYFWGIKKIP